MQFEYVCPKCGWSTFTDIEDPLRTLDVADEWNHTDGKGKRHMVIFSITLEDKT